MRITLFVLFTRTLQHMDTHSQAPLPQHTKVQAYLPQEKLKSNVKAAKKAQGKEKNNVPQTYTVAKVDNKGKENE